MLSGALVLAVLFAVTGPTTARGDGVYGRFEGDLTVSAAAGAGVRWAGPEDGAVATASLRFRYLDAVGPLVAGEWSPGGRGRVLLGLELRPLFPALLFSGLSSGNAWLDLWLQSIGVDLAMAFEDDGQALGVAFVVGLACELPLLMPHRADAPDRWPGINLRLLTRHRAAPAGAIAGPAAGASDWLLAAELVFWFTADAGLVNR